MSGAEREPSRKLHLRTAALLGVLFGILVCIVLVLSLWLLGLLLQLAA
ncbi:hypothetical protein OO015_06065 [Thermomicrobium sp. 4228-Ro]|nr:hypothetical protein [Thermomicrobium sp. 4228-Ro]MCX2727061.1 hypothetical protein [Thermomicrobium sp. 4228-Ro]